MTDNGSFFTKPYTPRTNGKAERFIPRFANGPTPRPIRTRTNDPLNCSTGSIATIGIDHMVAWRTFSPRARIGQMRSLASADNNGGHCPLNPHSPDDALICARLTAIQI
jgi:hypothetical protein